jgi:hypothetical protein
MLGRLLLGGVIGGIAVFDAAKDRVTSTLQAGQDVIRPARITGDPR